MSAKAALFLFVGCAGLTLVASACPAEQGTAIEHGQAVFGDPSISGTTTNQMSCATCHDIHAGESGIDKPGAPLAGVLSRPTYWGGQEDTLLGSINACLYYHMLKNDPWDGTEDEATALYAYLESVEAKASDAEKQPVSFTIPDLTGVPAAGDSAHGKVLYGSACESCHGAKSSGEGRTVDVSPVLPDQTLKAHPAPMYTDADRRLVFIEKTRHGGFFGYGGQMPPFSAEVLSDQDVADILTFLGVP